MKKIIAVICLISFIVSGCAGTDTKQTKVSQEEALAGSEELAADIRKKYSANEKYEYTDPIYDIARDEPLTIQVDFNPEEHEELENWDQVAVLYQDADFKMEASSNYEFDKESGELKIQPWKTPNMSISSMGLSKSEYGVDGNSTTLFARDQYEDWGNLGKMYMVQKLDMKTGEPLEKPLVTVVTVKGETDAPVLRFKETEDGIAAFTWEPVEGAEKYILAEIDYSQEYGFNYSTARPIDITEDTHWEAEALNGDILFNSDFTTFSVSEDEWNDENEELTAYFLEEYGEENQGKAVRKDTDYITYYGLFAVTKDGASMVSNMYSEDELASLLVYMEAYRTGEEGTSDYAKGVMAVQTHRWVTMCDGRAVQKVVNYDVSSAEETVRQYGVYEKEDMSDLELVDVEVVEIPYTVEGTPLSGTMIIEDYDKDALEEDLKALKERQDSFRTRTGTIGTGIQKKFAHNEITTIPETDKSKELSITANSALSEYLAVNMLAGAQIVDLNEFKESSDTEYLLDAFQEARYQNPLILGIADVGLSADGRYLYISYENSVEERAGKQAEIQEEVDAVTADIITGDMSDLEKELAINQYLCDNAEYDMEALENAAGYDYLKVDEEFYDSFTPYGVLINKSGVCASYAGAFKLLADAAGLESIVVTGYLEGSLAHAWNKVNIDDQWMAVDSTNNSMEELPNVLMNLPDGASAAVLVEDMDFVMDEKISEYSSQSDEFEYYHIKDKFFDVSSITDELAKELKAEGKAVLRTKYELTDAVFAEIAASVTEETGKDLREGYYWMGVIYLSE